MTDEQKAVVSATLVHYVDDGVPIFHNGLAVGADHEAAIIAKGLGYYIMGYPSDDKRQTCSFIPDHYAQEPKYPTERNPDIVNASELMLAAPDGFFPKRRSGTWSTIRCSIRTGTPITIIYPDGTTEQS
jgi:hypothetical protein